MMSRIHIPRYNPRALDTFISAAGSENVQDLIANAIDSTPFEIRAVSGLGDFHRFLMEDGFRLGILELALAGDLIHLFLSDVSRIIPHVALILIAENPGEAQTMNIDMSGCVHHLFLDYPSVEHLRAFLLAVQKNQQERIQGPVFSAR